MTAWPAADSVWERAARKLEGTLRSAKDAKTPGELAQILDPRTVQTPALDLIDEHLVKHSCPYGRLMVALAPQEGKSTRCAHYFPLWLLIRNPDLRIGIASYESTIARRWGRAIRNTIIAHPELGLKVKADTAAAHEWALDGFHPDQDGNPDSLNPYRGGIITAGLDAAITGRPLDCVSGDTYIITDRGRVTAADAYRTGISWILAYDHATGRAVWRAVEAARRIPGRRVVTVVTESGRRITCTPDHRVYTSRGYLPADRLQVRDSLVAVVAAARMPMRESVGCTEDGRTEGDTSRAESLLHTPVHGADVLSGEPDPVLPVRQIHPPQPPVNVLSRVRPIPTGIVCREKGVRALRRPVPASVQSDQVLRAQLRQPSPLRADDRSRELALQDGHELRALLPVDATTDLRAGRPAVRRLLGQSGGHLPAPGSDGPAVSAGRSPHRRGRDEQPSREPDHAVQQLPHHTPQVETDTVAVVLDSGDAPVDVYDFQVAGTRNFFADGVLVHNCLIIDDPVKDRAQAESQTYRDRAWQWWTDAARPRFGPGAIVVVVQTRWHEDDLTGRLQAQDADDWVVLNIPTQADHRPEKGETDPLGREPGEYMESARGDRMPDWLAQQKQPSTWAALYQGRPAPAEGSLLKRQFWQRYDAPRYTIQPDGTYLVLGADEVIQSWDMAFKDTKASDYVVCQIWARYSNDAYLLWQLRDRLSFTATVKAMRKVARDWPQARLKLVEDKANGTAVIDHLHREISGLVAVPVSDGKYARAVAVQPHVESRHVYLPGDNLAPWVQGFIDECATFPNSTNDDQVDTFTQATDRLLGHPVKASTRRPPSRVPLPSGMGAALGGNQGGLRSGFGR